MVVELPFDAAPGDRFDIDDLAHVLARVDHDGEFVFRRLGTQKTFKVPNAATGMPEHPDAARVLELMAGNRIVAMPRDPDSEAAAARRRAELQAADARRLDATSDLRVDFLRAYDDDKCNLSDAALRRFYEKRLEDPRFHALACSAPKAKRRGRKVAPWRPCGRTLRTWILHRGTDGDRQQRDGVSDTGRGRRVRKLRHPKEILAHWLSRASVNKRDVLKNHVSYEAELARVSRGEPTGRFDEHGEPVTFAQPRTPYSGVSYSTFRRCVLRLRGKEQIEGRYGKEAAAADYGGGGRMTRATHVGAICSIDDTPVPILGKIEAAGLVWVGTPTMTLLKDLCCHGFMGGDVSWDEASSATVLRTVADASTPKRVPKDMPQHAQLSMMMVKPDRLVMDNLSAHHSRHVEDSLREIHTDADFTGAGQARDKASQERAMGVVLDAFKGLTAATEAIALRRHTKNDPPAELLPTIAQLRALMPRIIAVLNISPTDALMGRSPLSFFLQKMQERKVAIIKDVAKFRRAIGCVEYDVDLRASGIEVFKGLRYVQPPRAPSLFAKLRHCERPSKKTKVASVPIKLKYDPGDLGRIHVWDPVDRTYVTFECDDPDYADGLPKWMHDLILSEIAKDELDFCSAATLKEYRARLFERQSAITQAASEDERRRAARMADSDIFKRVMGDIAEVIDEEQFLPLPDVGSDDRFADHELSSETSIDATVPTPRSAPVEGIARRHKPSTRRGRVETEDRGASRHAPRGGGDQRPPRPKSSSNRRISWSE